MAYPCTMTSRIWWLAATRATSPSRTSITPPTWTSRASWSCAPRRSATTISPSCRSAASRRRTRASGFGPSSPTSRPASRRRSPRCYITSTRAGSIGTSRTSPSSTTPTCRLISRGSCCAWRASSGSRAQRNAPVSSRRRRAWPGCASAVPSTGRARRWGSGRTCAPSSAAVEAVSGARTSPTADLAAYEARVAALVGPDLAAWVHGGRLASGIDPDR